MRRFHLLRHHDLSGVSGRGEVAEGVQFTDGTVVIRWAGTHASVVVWPSIGDAQAVHGHGGATEFIFMDEGGDRD